MTTFRPTRVLGLVGLGDAGDNLTHLGAYIDFQTQQLVRALHLFGDLHLANPQLDFEEIVDGDLVVG